jgi:hypothetical protein
MRKSPYLTGLLMLGLAGAAFAQDTKPAAQPTDDVQPLPSIVKKKDGVPQIPLVPEKRSNAKLTIPEVDFRFGYAPQNAKIAHNYWLKNEGPDSLRLIDVRPGCGCTKAPLKTRILGPGDSTDVELVFSTGKYSSRTAKSATVLSDANHTVPNLTFSAHPTPKLDSLKPFVVNPPLVNLDSLKDAGMAGAVEIRVKNTSDEPINLRLVSAPDQWFTVDVPGGAIAPGSEDAIQVRIAGDITAEILNKSFTIEASDTAMTRFSVPIQKTQRWGPTTSSTP